MLGPAQKQRVPQRTSRASDDTKTSRQAPLLFSGQTNLHCLVQANKIASTVRFLKTNKEQDINATDFGGWTPLHVAAQNGFDELAIELIRYGANVERKDDVNRTPLHLAATSGNAKVVRVLLDHRACINVKDSIGRSPLNYAILAVDVESARQLLLTGAEFTDDEIRLPSPDKQAQSAPKCVKGQPRITRFFQGGQHAQQAERVLPAVTSIHPQQHMFQQFGCLKERWTLCCFLDTWLEQPCKTFIIHLVLALSRIEANGAPHVPGEILCLIFKNMNGRDFIARPAADKKIQL
eukprot:m.71496 g.71496  ORF g.71496 m.71496 type:complete len:293 (+) comp24355_c0_seq1:125-1003(+)